MPSNLTRAPFPITAATLLLALSLAGCKGFWDPPVGTGRSTGTTPTTTTLTTSGSPVAAGASLTLTATVAPAAATGAVTFSSGTATLGTGTLTSSSASFTATFSTAGTESLTATYGGDSTYASSTSSAVAITVTSASQAALGRAFNAASAKRDMNLVLAPDTPWTAPATVHLHNLARVVADGSLIVNLNADHCVLYSGTVFMADGSRTRTGVYDLQGGGYLAPELKGAELGCE
jgi:hypothetical protein